jgi:calcineurin-like phosphoesterase family protein
VGRYKPPILGKNFEVEPTILEGFQYVTADTHFFHGNIIEYTNRPFSNVYEMNEQLIINWNDEVRQEDKVLVVGDFGFMGVRTGAEILARLHGKKYIVLGNHDENVSRALRMGFEGAFTHPVMLNHGRSNFLVCHFPFRPNLGKRLNWYVRGGRGVRRNMSLKERIRAPYWRYFPQIPIWWDGSMCLLHGHTHREPRIDCVRHMINVGVDLWAYRPVSLDEICVEI